LVAQDPSVRRRHSTWPGRTLAAIAALAAAAGLSASAGARPFAATSASTNAIAACRTGYYQNVDGKCVHGPSSSPAAATARCRDGTYSYSLHASGTCSHHGGVARWIHHP